MNVAWDVITGLVAFAGLGSLVALVVAVVYGASTKRWSVTKKLGIATGVIWVMVVVVYAIDTSDIEDVPIPVPTVARDFEVECGALALFVSLGKEGGWSNEQILSAFSEATGASTREVESVISMCADILRE